MQTFHDQLALVPSPIKDWLGSEDAIEQIEHIERQFSISEHEQRLVPRMLFDIETKQLLPAQLRERVMRDFATDTDTAQQMADEIVLRLLMPITNELRAHGIIVGAPSTFEVAPVPLNTLSPIAPSAAPSTSIPVAPVAVQAVPVPSAPIPLHNEASSVAFGQDITLPSAFTASQPTAHTQLDGTPSPTTSSAPRMAHLELGARQREDLDAIFKVNRETAPISTVHYTYGGPTTSIDTTIPQPSTIPGASRAPLITATEGLHDAADRNTPLPPGESIELPTPVHALPDQAPDDGLIDSLIKHVAPWHYAHFEQGDRAATVLATPTPDRVVDYTQPTTPTPAPATKKPTSL